MIAPSMRPLASVFCVVLAAPALAGDPRPGLAMWGAGDPAAAREALSPLAEAGDPIAAAALGAMYDRGEGTVPDPAAARAWYGRAAEGGVAIAAARLGLLLEDAGADDAALTAWRRGAQAGDPHSKYDLALRLLASGRGDDVEAATLMRAAADAGLARAQYAWGMLALTGRGTSADPAAGRAALQAAATAGYAPAQHNLALLLEAGIGGPADAAASASWRALASAAERSPRLDAAPAVPAAAATPAPVDSDAPAIAPALHDADWIASRDPEHFTVQIATGDDEQALVRFLQRQSLPGDLAHFRFESSAGPRYSAIYGAWADAGEARAALEALPESLQQARPWIRRFRELQSGAAQPAP